MRTEKVKYHGKKHFYCFYFKVLLGLSVIGDGTTVCIMEKRCRDKHFSMIIYLLHKFIIADMIRAKRAVHLYYVYASYYD